MSRLRRVITALIMAFTFAAPAVAVQAHQPYGGCDEAWQAPRSAGADHCRDHGWTVRKNFVLSPSNTVRMIALQPCRYEDSGNCYWNARVMGDGRGDSFIIKGQRDGKHRVWWVRFATDPHGRTAGR